MKKRLLAALLTAAMLFSVLPASALAAEGDTAVEPCTVTEGCTLEAGHDGECVLPDEPETQEGDTNSYYEFEDVYGVDEDTVVISPIQERIDALPSVEELEGMDKDEQAEVCAEVYAIYDAIDELTDEEAGALDMSALEEAAAFFTRQIMRLDTNPMSGNCGATDSESSVTWKLEQNNQDDDNPTYTLIISGSGAMADYTWNGSSTSAPWSVYANNITKLEVADEITYIGKFAFYNLKTLTGSPVFPEKLEGIGAYGYGKNNFTSVDWDAYPLTTIPAGLLDGNSNYKGNGEGNTLVLPDKITSIGQAAFRGTGIEGALVLGENIQELADGHVFQNTKITSVTFKNPDCNLSKNCFASCADLKEVSLPANLSDLPDAIFSSCTSLKSIDLGNVETVGSSAFQGSGIENVTGNFVKLIKNHAFQGSKLTSASFPLVTEIQNNAFANITTLTSANIPQASIIGNSGFGSCSQLTTVTTSNALTTVGNSAFSNCSNLTGNIDLSNVSQIGTGAFQNCSLLKDITSTTEQLTSLGERAFQGCSLLAANMDLSGVTTIPNSAFNSCNALKNVKINPDTISVGDSAFYNCAALSGFLDFSKVTSVGYAAFTGCNALDGIYFGSLASVGTNTNGGKNSFTSTTIYVVDQTQGSLVSAAFGNPRGIVAVTDGGTIPADTEFTSNTLATPIKDGYTFGGWYSDSSFGTAVTTLTAGQTYYAKWTASSYSVDHSLSFDALTYGDTPVSKTLTVTASGVKNASVTEVEGSDSFTASASGMTITVTPNENLSVGTYNETIVVTTGDGATHNVAVSLTVTKAGSTVTPGDDNNGSITATYGDTITLIAKTQRATENGVALLTALDEVDFIYGNTVLGSAPVSYDENGVGTATLTYNTSKGGIPVNQEVWITAQYGGSVNLNGTSGNIISVKLSPKALTITGLTATDRAYDGTTAVALSGGELSGIIGNDDVSTTMPTSGTVESADAGTNKAVTVPAITLSGDDAGKYALTQPTVTVNITKTTPTISLSASPETLTGSGTVTLTVSGLPDGASAAPTCDGVTVSLNSDGTYSVSLPNETKEYTFTVSYEGDDNHEATTATCTVSVTSKSGSSEDTKVEVSGLTTVPEGLSEKYQSVDELTTALKTEITQINSAVPASNIAVYDVKLMVTTDGGRTWEVATKDNFPANGQLTITLPYPEGTNSRYTFTVVHMFTTSDFNKTPGNTEKPPVTNTADGIQFTVTGLSPISVGWTAPQSTGGGGGGSGSSTYTVTVDSAKNGTVKADRTSASKGTTVTLTVKPNSGYELDDLTVTDKNGDTVKLTRKSDTQYTFTMPASKVTVEASFTEIEEQPAVSFVDVSTSAYYYDAVAWAVENGVTSGTSATTFSPDAACTRAQAVTFLWRAAGSPAPKSSVNPFADVSASAYYYDAVLWAVEQGITAGTSATTFSPDATCTRGQIVTFLYRADGTATTSNNPFTDVADNAYYAGAVKWAVAEGVTAGTSATTFSPDASCTRAQIVTFLYRAYA